MRVDEQELLTVMNVVLKAGEAWRNSSSVQT
jgi:hypothetical protein